MKDDVKPLPDSHRLFNLPEPPMQLNGIDETLRERERRRQERLRTRQFNPLDNWRGNS